VTYKDVGQGNKKSTMIRVKPIALQLLVKRNIANAGDKLIEK